MPITVIVRHQAGDASRLTFDGTQRVVIGRGAGSDVRLPEPSVSHRHASLRAQGAEFTLLDEGSTNGTFVGDVRIAPRTSRIVRSGDMVRVGRVWLELRVDREPVTRDVAAATRDLALALVSRAMAAMGTDRSTKVRVVEGRDQGAVLSLAEEGRVYAIGREPHCDLVLVDPDSSREHLHVILRASAVFVRDRAAKNGTYIGEVRVPDDKEVLWRPTNMIRIGRTVLALEEPIVEALYDIERAADEALDAEPRCLPPPPPDGSSAPAASAEMTASSNPLASAESAVASAPAARSRAAKMRGRWSVTDVLVMTAAVSVLALSLAGLVWLLHG
jgi:pSer/pThr/pTyr-binding forkhead associated (FHA) protein